MGGKAANRHAADVASDDATLEQRAQPSPLALAMLAFAGAVAALVKFPSTPTPPSLIKRLDDAVAGVRAAAESETAQAVTIDAGGLDIEALKTELTAALGRPSAVAVAEDRALSGEEIDGKLSDLHVRLSALEAAKA